MERKLTSQNTVAIATSENVDKQLSHLKICAWLINSLWKFQLLRVKPPRQSGKTWRRVGVASTSLHSRARRFSINYIDFFPWDSSPFVSFGHRSRTAAFWINKTRPVRTLLRHECNPVRLQHFRDKSFSVLILPGKNFVDAEIEGKTAKELFWIYFWIVLRIFCSLGLVSLITLYWK